jgi:type IV secretory pathway VirB10-like protein
MSQENQNPASETAQSQPSPGVELRDHRPNPQGVVPKQSQAYVIVGLAVLILFAVMFSNKHARPAPNAGTAQAVYSNDANQHEIEELKRGLTEDQRKVEQQSQSPAHSIAGASSASQQFAPAERTGNGTSEVASEPRRDQLADAERALLFKARFASNLVSSGSPTGQPFHDDMRDVGQSSWSSETAPSLRAPQTAHAEGTQAGQPARRAPEVNVNSAEGQPYVLFEGTTVDTALVNRLDGEFAGPVKVMTTNPVYSQDRQHVLIPEGTFILGDVQKVSGFGQKRLAVTFHRMLMPDGYSVDLDQFHGLDQAGETGLKDKVNNHYLQIFGTSIALGIIAGAAQSTTNGGLSASGSDLWRQGVASSLSQSSTNVLDRFINVPPTLTIREGHRIKIYLTQDLLLPAYENHTIPPNI